MKIDPQAEIEGVSHLEVRRLLRAFEGSWRVENVQAFLGISKSKASRLVRALVDRGLIAEEEEEKKEKKVKGVRYWRATIAGGAFALASAAKPLRRATVQRILDRFLNRVREVNSSPEYLYEVKRVAVFGSYLSDAERINDIDIGIELARKQTDVDLFAKASQAQSKAAEDSGRRFGTYLDFLCWPEQRVWLFLKSRSRALSLHRIEDPIALGAELEVIMGDPIDREDIS